MEEYILKLICKCGNIEELKTDSKLVNYEIKDCNDGTIAMICKGCNAIVFMNLNKN